MTTLIVTAGVTSSGVTLKNGDFLYVSAGGTVTGSVVSSGGTAELFTGGMAGATVVSKGGTAQVLSGGLAASTVVSKGGTATVFSGGMAGFTMVSRGGTAQVLSGGLADSTVVSAGGTQIVASGGIASGTFLATAGIERVSIGGVASGGIVSGGYEYISGLSDDTVLSAGSEYVDSGGLAVDNIVSGRGKLFVFSAAVASGTVLTGGYQYLFSAGLAVDTLVDSGGVEVLNSAGTASRTLVLSGGQETVQSGGIAKASVISGGIEVVFGQASGTVLSGGNQNVYAGGVASGTVVRGLGAILEILSAGQVIGGTVSSGGQEVVQAGGVASGATVSGGGTLVVDAGATAQYIVISQGGSIDFPNLAFSSGGTASVDGADVLTVAEGAGSATLALSGQYGGRVFQTAPEPNGGSGTVVTLTGVGSDPPPQPRALTWVGTQDTNFGNAGNWNDLTNGLRPTTTSPTQMDTASFLSGGGTVTGAGTATALTFGGAASWDVTSGAILAAATSVAVGQGGVTTLRIDSGASISGLGVSDDISGDSGQTASVVVDGSGSSWKSAGLLAVGNLGAGQLTVSNAAHVSAAAEGSQPAMALGTTAGGNGALLVSGAGSLATLGGQLDVGVLGAGTMTVSNQGTAAVVQALGSALKDDVEIGLMPGASGEVLVTGTQSLLTNAGQLVVGDAGTGRLLIEAGGSVVTTPAAGGPGLTPGLIIANAPGAAGSSVDVFDPGSLLVVTGLLDVGTAGAGSLELGGGATVTAGSLDAGNAAAAIAQIGLSGIGTALIIANAATVADDGTAVLSVLSGATFAAASLTIGNTGNSSGALIVSGTGSVVNLSGVLNIGTALGTGDLTVGPGAAVHASVVNLRGQVVLEGGLLDPTVNLIGQGQTAGGFGTISAGDIIDEGVIQAGGTRLLVVQGTVVGGGMLTINGTVQAYNPAGVLQINAGGTMELTGPVLNAAATTFTDSLTPTGAYTVNNSVIDVTFADAAGVLQLDSIAGFAGTISTYHAGDAFVIAGGTLSGLGVNNGTTLTVHDSGTGAGVGGIDSIIFGSAIDPATLSIVNGNTIVACFAAGTRIETENGPVAVEALAVGDRVITIDGVSEPIVWTGSWKVNCLRHPSPETVWPVRIARGAFGENTPSRDLFVSPDHAIYVDDMLIPAKHFINGGSVRQIRRRHVVYHHIQLARHDIISAEGLPAETYLDIGDRAKVSGFWVTASHPEFSARMWETEGRAPLIVTGPRLAAVLARLFQRKAGTSGRGMRRPSTALRPCIA